MGLKENDIIIKMDGIEAENIGELLKLRSKKKRGENFTLTVLHDENETQLSGQFPEVTQYNALNYSKPSAAVNAIHYGNHFNIETSLVSKIALYIHPYMINLDIPVVVTINGKEVFNEMVGIDREFMIQNFIENFDKKALWINKIIFIINE